MRAESWVLRDRDIIWIACFQGAALAFIAVLAWRHHICVEEVGRVYDTHFGRKTELSVTFYTFLCSFISYYIICLFGSGFFGWRINCM